MKIPISIHRGSQRITWIFLLLSVAIGCDSARKSAPGADKKGNASLPPYQVTKPSMEEALPFFTEGFNTLISTMERPLNEYRKKIGEAKGPVNRAPNLAEFTVEEEQKVDKAAGLFAQGKQVTPDGRTEMIVPADQALVAAHAIIRDYKDAVQYYSNRKYEDDKGAGRKEIHRKITEHIRRFMSHLADLDTALATVETKQAEEDFKRHRDPTTYGYQFRAFNIKAMAFVNARETVSETDKAFGELEVAYKRIKNYSAAKGDGLHPTFRSYMRRVDDFYTHAVIIRRELVAQASEARQNRNFDSMVAIYNNIIEFTNSLYELESLGALK